MSDAPQCAHLPARARCSRGEVALTFCRFLEERSIAYALLSDPQPLQGEGPPGDVDLVAEPSCSRQLPALVHAFCRAQGLRLLQVRQYEWSARCFVLAWRDAPAGPVQYLYLDVCTAYETQTRRWLAARELLAGRSRSPAAAGVPGPFVPAPELQFAAYALKKVGKCAVDSEQLAFLRALFARAPQACRAQLRRFWSEPSAERIARGIEGDSDALRRALPMLARELLRRRRLGPVQGAREFARAVRRTLQPTGYWIAFLGPDGAGKSTIAERVSRVLAPAFQLLACYHLRPHWLGRAGSGAPVVDPHGKPPRGRLASAAKLVLWWLDGALGHALAILPLQIRSGLVIFDRHALDLVVDPRRYRFRGSVRAAEWWLRRMAQPAFFAVLDAPVEVLHQRKCEVSALEAARQRQAYRELAGRLPDAALIDAARDIDAICDDVVDCVLERMERRTVRRLGLDPAPGAASRAAAP